MLETCKQMMVHTWSMAQGTPSRQFVVHVLTLVSLLCLLQLRSIQRSLVEADASPLKIFVLPLHMRIPPQTAQAGNTIPWYPKTPTLKILRRLVWSETFLYAVLTSSWPRAPQTFWGTLTPPRKYRNFARSWGFAAAPCLSKPKLHHCAFSHLVHMMMSSVQTTWPSLKGLWPSNGRKEVVAVDFRRKHSDHGQEAVFRLFPEQAR